jgi:hypothetical protein
MRINYAYTGYNDCLDFPVAFHIDWRPASKYLSTPKHYVQKVYSILVLTTPAIGGLSTRRLLANLYFVPS